jgi:hypothetical protein
LTFRDYTYYTPDIDPLNQEPTPQEYLPESLAYFHLDHLGTPIEMTDQTGNTVWEASYKAWGEVETVSGSLKPLQNLLASLNFVSGCLKIPATKSPKSHHTKRDFPFQAA